MYSELDKCSKRKSSIVMICGLIVTAIGIAAVITAWKIVSLVLAEQASDWSPFNTANIVYVSLWLLTAVSTLIAGVSLIISAVKRKEYDLIPGPTLYFLGLSLAIIGGFLTIGGLYWQGLIAIVVGLLLIYWEWGFHVS